MVVLDRVSVLQTHWTENDTTEQRLEKDAVAWRRMNEFRISINGYSVLTVSSWVFQCFPWRRYCLSLPWRGGYGYWYRIPYSRDIWWLRFASMCLNQLWIQHTLLSELRTIGSQATDYGRQILRLTQLDQSKEYVHSLVEKKDCDGICCKNRLKQN